MEHGTLCLTRKPNETVSMLFIDKTGTSQKISLTISNVNGNQIRMAVTAPKSVTILREELLGRN